jgi:branched-chain amino acid transport system substrate-binding protein
MTPMRSALLAALVLLAAIAPAGAAGAKAYGPGVSDSEIKLGQTMPFSGPLSAYSTVGRAMAAYFAKVNAEGGVNGRKITLISLDDGFSPPKTVEQTRKLVEQENVFVIFASLGTATNASIQKYLNARKIPQLFIQSGASRWNDPQHFPWSIPGLPDYLTEAHAYAQYILAHKPDAKIGVLYQNDDFGKDYLKGLRDGLGDRAAKMIVSEQSYEVTDPTVDSQIITLSGSGADTFISASTQKATSQAIRKAGEIGWHPLFFISAISSSIKSVLTPAGLDRATGIISAAFVKDPTDPRWQDDAQYQAWLAWMKQYYPEGAVTEQLNVSGYWTAATMVEVLKRCGDDLTRENVLKQMTRLDGFAAPMLLPGITVNLSPDNYVLFKRTQLERFDGKQWVPIGKPVGG